MATLYIKRNTTCRTLLLFIFLLLLFFSPLLTSATGHGAINTSFVPLVGIPGVTDSRDFSGFLKAVFDIVLAIAAALAVVMITIGGLQYMTTDSVYNKREGIDKIQNALIGLLIALLIFLILNTINPNLLEFDIDITQVTIDESALPGATSVGTSTPAGASLQPNQ